LFWKAFPEKYIDMLIFFAVAENVSSKLIIAIRKILICCILIIASSYGSRISNKNNAQKIYTILSEQFQNPIKK
jgi:uncharacterized membrane protein YvbJ